MLKATYKVKSNYEFDPSHRGAPYVYARDKYATYYMNFGNLCECAANEFFFGEFSYDIFCVPFDKGSDIELDNDINISVKASGSALACLYGESVEAITAEYFARTHSNRWLYVAQVDGEFILYLMNIDEFKEFISTFGKLERESGTADKMKVRFKKTSGKMLKWFDERVEGDLDPFYGDED